MNPKIAIPAALVAIAAASSGKASAQEKPYLQQYVEPPRKAFELTLGTGYTQGFGQLYNGVSMPSVAHEGIALNLGLGYRLNPHWMIGVAGEYSELNAMRAASARGVATGLQAAYHFLPAERVDPWVAIGTGYRWLWERYDTPASVLVTQGLQAGRLALGADIRTSREFAIGPVIGGDVDVFLAQDNGGISDPRVSTFVYAGLQGRFDVGGERDRTDEGVTELQPASKVTYASPLVSVSNEIVTACNMILSAPPGFGFDDTELTDADRTVLNAVATCFTAGPLKGNRMSLVGHADPRGTPDYNMDLAARRADSVAAYLNGQGVARTLMSETSRGSLDATGTDEAGWARDRRVDIFIDR
jgi:outer membrane protein OmpA-like peptidoglycan-associated protein